MLTISNPKTRKGEARGYLTGVLMLAPSRNARGADVCLDASPGCRAACLYKAGRGAMQRTQDARIRRTVYFLNAPKPFMADLDKSIGALVRKATREGLEPVVRLNGTSDIAWETIHDDDGHNVMERFPGVQFYDYTKSPGRALLAIADRANCWPGNYHLTFSRSEENDAQCFEVLRAGGSVAVVGSYDSANWWWRNANGIDAYGLLVDGDANDLRFLDDPCSIVVLRPKGPALHDRTGFVLLPVSWADAQEKAS